MMSDLFVLGEFESHSGVKLDWKIECDALSDKDWYTLAVIAADILPPFGAVEGVPTGGEKFAAALENFTTTGPLLIVDDVLTTGASMHEHRAGRPAIGCVAFSRADEIPNWIFPVFTTIKKGWW